MVRVGVIIIFLEGVLSFIHLLNFVNSTEIYNYKQRKQEI